MLLKDRKRINNIPKFNSGFDSSSMFGLQFSINKPTYLTGAGVTNDASQVPWLLQQNGVSNLSFMNTSASLMNQDTFGLLMKDSGNGKSGLSAGSIAGGIMSKAGGVIGGAFDLSYKFSDSASNNYKTASGIAGQLIPGKYGEITSGVLLGISDYTGMKNYKISGSLMRNESGVSNSQIGGINYTTQNLSDTAKAYKDVSSTSTKNTISMTGKGMATGAALGSVIPGLGTIAGGAIGGIVGLFGGLFGGHKAKVRLRRINRNQLMQDQMINLQQMSYANSEALQNKYYSNNRDTTGDILYANRGKDLRLRKRINNKKR